MSELQTVYESGDCIYVKDGSGRVLVYVVRSDGTVILWHGPS